METAEEQYVFWKALTYVADHLRSLVTPASVKEQYDISLRQHHVMTEICRLTGTRKDGINLKELAECLKLSPATVSELVETLVRKDLLQRIQNPQDRRAVLITLTERSSAMLEDGRRRMNEGTAKILSRLGQSERAVMVNGMKQLEQYMKELEHEKE